MTSELSSSEPPDSGSHSASVDSAPIDSEGPKHQSSRPRIHWKWNRRLLKRSVLILGILLPVLFAVHWWQSRAIAGSLQAMAQRAEQSGDLENQIRWLKQYRLIAPKDLQSQVDLADACDHAVDLPPANRIDRVDRARTALRDAVAKLQQHDDWAEVTERLRRRLISRLLQYGGRFASDVQRHVIALDAAQGDAEALRATAYSLISRRTESPSTRKPDETYEREDNYWGWLYQQAMGDVLQLAWQANPNELAIAGVLIEQALTRPQLFTGTVVDTSAPDPWQIAAEIASDLLDRTEDGQAQWIAYQYLQRTDPDSATATLAQQAQQAIKRLQVVGAEIAAQDQEGDSQTGITQAILPAAERSQSYVPFWDYEICLAYALQRSVTPDSPNPTDDGFATEEARVQMLDALVELPLMDVSRTSAETAFLNRGQFDWLAGRRDQAWQTWKRGIDQLADDSLNLQLIFVSTVAEFGDLDAARKANDDLNRLIRRKMQQLSGVDGARFSAARRSELETQLDQAIWTNRLIEGQIKLRAENYDPAIKQLQASLDSQVSIPDRQRTVAATLLGTAYEQLQLWDLAAAAFERAAGLAPDQPQHRIAAARSWTTAGNFQAAERHWRALDSGSLPVLLQRARLMVQQQLALPPPSRNLKNISNSMDKLRQQIQRLPAEATPQRDMLMAQWQLISLAIQPEGQGKQADSIDRLLELSEQYPDNEEMQSAAAYALASRADQQRLDQVLSRLAAIHGSQTVEYALIAARAEVMGGNLNQAIERLMDHAAKHPSAAKTVLKVAADYAEATGDRQQAYELLQQIPPPERGAVHLFQLFSIANIREATRPLDGTAPALEGESERWEQELRKLEGESGTWWRLARATRLLRLASQENPNDQRRREILQEVERLQATIMARRPQWALASTLVGQTAMVRGQTQRAIERLREGIRTGDRRASTILMLVSQLTAAGKTDEAERELAWFAQSTQSDPTIATLSIALSEKRGELRQGLEMARAMTQANPDDPNGWLLRGQVAAATLLESEGSEETEQNSELLAEANSSYRRALKLSKDSSLQAYQLLARLAFSQSDPQLQQILEQALKSNVAEPRRSLFVASSYLQINEPDAALPVLNQARKNSPQDPDLLLAFSDYYRQVRDDAQSLAMLEQAYQAAPTRLDIRNRLAIALALRQGAEIPWRRLDQLLQSEDTSSQSNRLLYALILMQRGDTEQQEQAATILRQLIRLGGEQTDDAMRLLAALETRRWVLGSEQEPESASSRRFLNEALRLYSEMTRRVPPAPIDLYRHGDLLLRADQLDQVPGLADRLDAVALGTGRGLELRLRLAKQAGEEVDVDSISNQWLEKVRQDDALALDTLLEIGGRTLSNLGFHRQAIDWLSQAYAKNGDKFSVYVTALARDGRFRDAAKICQTHFRKNKEPLAISTLADIVIMGGLHGNVTAELEQSFTQALRSYGDDARLVEAIATLRLAQHRYAEAVLLYERAEQLAPRNVRVLNNLAMALSEIDGRQSDALPRIQRAIEIHGRSPELLDTQGVVLLRNDRIAEAINALQEASALSDDPRFRFHLISALVAANKTEEAKLHWEKLDFAGLTGSVLTPAERDEITELERLFR